MGVGLEIDLLDPAVLDEVVDVGAAPGSGEDVVDIRQGDPQGAGPHIVDVELELGGVILAVGAHRDQLGVFHGHAQQLVAGLHQLFMPQAATVLQLEVEAVGHTQLKHRRR